MKSRRNYLKFRKNQFKWKQLGWHSDSVCPDCGQKGIYQIDQYDAWCCIFCNVWLDEVCGDPDCPFCGKRPETPYEAYFLKDLETNSVGKRKYWRRKNYQHKTDGRRKQERKRSNSLLKQYRGQKRDMHRYKHEKQRDKILAVLDLTKQR